MAGIVAEAIAVVNEVARNRLCGRFESREGRGRYLAAASVKKLILLGANLAETGWVFDGQVTQAGPEIGLAAPCML